MLTSFASMQLESDSRHFGNPKRFIPVGKCSRKIAAAKRMDSKRQLEAKQLETPPETEPTRAPQPAVMAYGWEDEPRQVSFFGN
jgi:hypothetical protein